MTYPNSEYGILTSTLDTEDIISAIAGQYRTTKEDVEISNKVTATVRRIVKYADLEEE